VRSGRRRRESLRPDTTLAPAGEPGRESYVRDLPPCCLRSLKEAVVVRRADEARRLLSLDCSCGRSWRVTSSLDEKITGRFVTHGGPRVGGASGGGNPPAA
jgi:hypothetical protein